MAGFAKVIVDHDEIASYLSGNGGISEMLEEKGQQVLEQARSTAPVSSGEYVTSLQMWTATTDRLVVRVGSDSPHAWAVEHRHGTLARALDAAA